MRYRVGNHNPALVYGEHDEAKHFTPQPAPELVAVFVRQGGEHELDALHYVRAMNATMPGCTCPVICCCGAFVGTTSGCETCAEHNGECLPNAQDAKAANLVPDDEALRAIGEDRAVLWLEDLNAAVDRLWPGAGWTPGDSADPRVVVDPGVQVEQAREVVATEEFRDGIVLELPPHPALGTVLVSVESGRRYVPCGNCWRPEDGDRVFQLGELLDAEGPLALAEVLEDERG